AVRAVSGSSSQLAITALRLERMLVEVGQLLEEGGVEFVVLKGLATRHLDHLETWHRQSSDVDLLVRREQLPIAGTILRDAGYTAPDEAHVLMDKGESWRSPLGDGVDLHTRLHTAARPLPTRWWQTTERFETAGHRFLALNRAGRLAHA
ncbi:MAG TPA: hypothetical protein DCS55_14995, partial [Acidimicrobiaceae bacterium]|nr:hypothetical protein [Acidimicrobiaceae bacterium]